MNQETANNKHDEDQQVEQETQEINEQQEADVEEQEVSEGSSETGEPSEELLQERIEELESELSQTKDDLIRTVAAMDNLQKRMERDIQNTRKFANDKIIKALIPVMDSFDKALEVIDSSDCEVTVEQMIEGTQMTQKICAQVLQDNGVVIVDPKDEKFDPELHEAMSMVEMPEVEKNTVIEVFQKGYLLNDRVIKAAMVVVAK